MDVLLFRALSLLGLAILVALAARRLRLPYTVGLVLAGAALAATRSHAGLALTHDLIFDVVLPPLLFEAALNLRWSDLQRDLVPVVALSTIGVALCALVVAGGLVTLLGWPLESALVFGALISATDPIAVIALIKELRVTGRLSLLIEAESLFNDGAAAVLFTLILVWAAHDPASAQDPLAILTTFVIVAGGGLAAGFGVGLIAIMIVGTSEDHLVETAVTAVAAFGSFLIAEHFGASGVLASVAAGMTLGNLGVLTEGAVWPLVHSAWTRVRARILGIRRVSRQFAGVPADRLGVGDCRFRPRGDFRAHAGHRARPFGPRGRRLSGLPGLPTLALGDPAQSAAPDVVGRLARRAGSGARARLACRSAAARRYSYLGLRGRRLLGDRARADGAAGAKGAGLTPKRKPGAKFN